MYLYYNCVVELLEFNKFYKLNHLYSLSKQENELSYWKFEEESNFPSKDCGLPTSYYEFCYIILLSREY